MKNNNVIFSLDQRYMLSSFLLIISFIINLLQKKKKNEKFVNFGLEERKKRVGMGREGKGLLFSFFYREIALTLSSPLLCLPLTQAKELDMSCDTIGTTFS